jgi:hypothetical protein
MPEYEETADAQIDRERTEEAQAFFSALAASTGLREPPRVNADSEPGSDLDLKSRLAKITKWKHVPAPLRLELYARLSQPSRPQEIDDSDVARLGESLVHQDHQADAPAVTTALRDVLGDWKEGQEPLGRTMFSDLETPPSGSLISLMPALDPDIQCTTLMIDAGCDAAKVEVEGTTALSIVTEMYTCKPFENFKGVVNPLRWPGCWLESFFFKSMVPVPNAPQISVPLPDGSFGWKQTLLETVDFGFSIAADGTQQLQTQLDFLYFWNDPEDATTGETHGIPGTSSPRVAFTAPTAPTALVGAAAPIPVVTRSQVPAAGCTYDLRSSHDNRILVDQGYLLVEEVPGHNYRRYRTQKEVRFGWGLPPHNLCSFWSLATAMIMQGC